MPRTNLPKDQPSVVRHGDPLPDEEKQKLLDLLSYRDTAEKSSLVIWDIEAALFLFVKGVAQIGNPPRPADYARTFKAVEGEAQKLPKTLLKLSETLFEMNYHYTEELSRRNVDPALIAAELGELARGPIAAALDKLAEASRAVIQEYQEKSSQGARTNIALVETIRRLRAAFARHFRGNAGLTSGQKRLKEIAFVKAALKVAKIPCRDFGRLMRDHRTTPS